MNFLLKYRWHTRYYIDISTNYRYTKHTHILIITKTLQVYIMSLICGLTPFHHLQTHFEYHRQLF